MPDTEQPAEHWGPKAENDHVLLKVCNTKKVTYATQIWGEKVQVVVIRSWPCIKVCVRCSRCSSLCKLRIRTRSDRAAACRTGNALCTQSTHRIVTSAPPAANPISAVRSGDQSRWPTILGCAQHTQNCDICSPCCKSCLCRPQWRSEQVTNHLRLRSGLPTLIYHLFTNFRTGQSELCLADWHNDNRTRYMHKSTHTNGVREVTAMHFLQLFPSIAFRADFTSKWKH